MFSMYGVFDAYATYEVSLFAAMINYKNLISVENSSVLWYQE